MANKILVPFDLMDELSQLVTSVKNHLPKSSFIWELHDVERLERAVSNLWLTKHINDCMKVAYEQGNLDEYNKLKRQKEGLNNE